MIEDKINIHDKHQFELQLGYDLNPLNQNSNFNLDIYLFFSSNLGLNPHTYTTQNFYSDLQNYTRLKTPNILLKNIYETQNSPLNKLKKNFKDFTLVQNQKADPENYYSQIKLFCCTFKNALKEHTDFIMSKKDQKDIEYLIKEYILHINNILEEYHSLRKIINVPIIKEKMFTVYQYGEEYLTYLTEDFTFPLIEWVKNIKNSKLQKETETLFIFIKQIQNSRKSYRQYINNQEELNNNHEKLIYRKNMLKKYMSTTLYLTTYRKKSGKLIEQAVMSISAGLAMFFATIIAFAAQMKYGMFTTNFFIILIISYMFKDRIKEISKFYFNIKLRNFLFDHVTNLYNNLKQKIGGSKESFGFIDITKVPSGILKIKNKDLVTKIDAEIDENVILYKRQIKINTKPFQKAYKSDHIDGIQEIFRFNIQKFLKRMDDPKKTLYLTTEDKYEKIHGDRVYYLNMVIKYTQDENYFFNSFRITLNQNGIKKIKKIYTNKNNL
ncbi:hypothetical protein HN362_01970 [bacterium]|nr:hypothetical protein [bacterium]MBT3581660.1 hypothetical protein [bacterium]